MFQVFRPAPHRTRPQPWIPSAAPAGTAHTHEIDDTIQGTDALAKTVTAPRADTATTTDAVDHQWNATKTVADTGTLTDATAKAATHPLADTGTLTDNQARVWAALRTIADTGELDDNVNTGGATGHTHEIDDTIQGTDALQKASGHPIADTIQGTDAQARAIGQTVTDLITGTDQTARAWATHHALADTAVLTDHTEAGIPADRWLLDPQTRWAGARDNRWPVDTQTRW